MIADNLRCPDDQGALVAADRTAQCSTCKRSFPLHAPNLIEIMPSRPFARTPRNRLETNNYSVYLEKFKTPFTWLDSPAPWAPPESLSDRETLRVGIQHRILEELLPADVGDFCDVSSGSGRQALPLLDRSRSATLCDVSVDDLNYVYLKAKARPRTRFVRCDYLQSPFADNSFDTILCTDTLIYGPDHEARLLSHLQRILRPGGRFVGDFKCKWHTHPVRGPYMIDYSWKEVRSMLEAAGFRKYRRTPYYQEAARIPLALARCLVPPTRYFVSAEKG